MAVYIYKAVDRSGNVVRNRVEENNKMALLKKLKENNLLPISVQQINVKTNNVKKQKRNIETNDSILKSVRRQEAMKNSASKTDRMMKQINEALGNAARVSHRDIVVFTQNFYLLKKANFNNIHALSTVLETIENPTLKAVVEDILVGVESGENMYITMEYYTGMFHPIYVNMVKVGELSGSLTTALEQAIRYLDESAALTKKIRTILLPNLITFIVLNLMMVLSSIFVVPLIQGVFEDVGSDAELPAATLAFQRFLDVLVEFWYIPTFVIIGAIVGIIFYIRSPQGRYNWHYFKYTAPIFGELIYAIDFSRLMKAVLLNIKNGMRIQEALDTGKNVVRNLVMMSLIETSMNNVLIGQSWIEPFEKSGLSSPMVTEMLKIGMQTDIAEMMERLLDYMEMDIDNIMQKIMKVLPQIVSAIVGVILIFAVLVIVVPLIQLYMGDWLFDAFL